MKKAWSIIIVVILVAILLGAVSVGVGFLTGADIGRIVSIIEARYNIDLGQLAADWYTYFTHDIPQFAADVYNALFYDSETVVVGVSTVG